MILVYLMSLILILGGAIWLVVIAFKDSVVWGLVVLFVPFAALVFVVKNWEKTKASFAAQVIGYTILFFFGPSPSRVAHYRQLAAARQNYSAPAGDTETSSNEDEASGYTYAPSGSGGSGTSSLTTTSAPNKQVSTAPPPATAVPHTAPLTGRIRLSEARNHIGERMRITSKQSVERVATLRKVDAHMFVFRLKTHGGNIVYRMHPGDIARLEVLGPGER